MQLQSNKPQSTAIRSDQCV